MEIKKNTFGWSAEEVLYKIFDVRTTRNHYLEVELRELLYLISIKSNDKKRIQELINPLSDLKLSEGDPLVKIISSSVKYLKSI